MVDLSRETVRHIHRCLSKQGYTVAEGPFPTGRPDQLALAATSRAGLPVIAKVYPAGRGQIAFANMVEVWRSSFGESRRPPGLPRVIDYLSDPEILIMERVAGRPLVESPALDPALLDDAIGLLASLHESDAKPSQVRSSKRIVKSIKRKTEDSLRLAPDLTETFSQATVELEERREGDRELVPSHGDFSPRNVVIGSGRLVVIDWDRFQIADPARDVAYLGTWCWAAHVRQGRQPDWSVLDRTVTKYDTLRPQAAVRERLHFHIAAGLIRIAHSIVESWPTERSAVPRLIQEAVRHLRMG